MLYTANASPNRAAQSLETGLVSLSKWCIQNRLTINAKKTNKHMILEQSGANNTVVNVNLNGASLDVVHSYNYLDVIIDDHLTFSGFLKSNCDKVNMRVFQLSIIRKYITSTR